MRRLALCILAVAAATVMLSGVALAQTTPQFKLGFKTLADMIPNVVGTPLEDEHYGPNGDSLQRTTTGLMVWRKADNWTAFTNGYITWVNGPFGLQQRLNSERFPWESTDLPPVPDLTSAPIAAPTAAPTPSPSPTPTPAPNAPQPPKATLRSSNLNVIQGQGLSAGVVWVMGEIHNESAVPAYNVLATARLISASGDTVGTANQSFAYLGPGDTVGYRIEVKTVQPYARADVSLDSSASGFASFDKPSIEWVKNDNQVGDSSVGARYEFTGNLKNTGTRPVGLNAVYVWFLDQQGNVVWMDYTYVTNTMNPGDSYTFVIRTPWSRDNPQIKAIEQVKYYAAGQLQ